MAVDRADLVVVGAGTVGGWASVFARSQGAGRVIVVDRGRAGDGASSRAAGMVRAQGGSPLTVALGRWSIEFYRSQQETFGTDSGFRELGYLILATTDDDVRVGKERVAMQARAGLDVRWLEPAEAQAVDPNLDPASFQGASYAPADGCIDPLRNVRAYSLAMQRAGVELREGTAFIGLRLHASPRAVIAVETDRGPIDTERVILTGGPLLYQVGQMAGIPIPAGAVRHQVFVTQPHPVFEVDRVAMGFDLAAGLYWRLEDGGLLFGMSNPDEPAGPARSIDWPYFDAMQKRLGRFLPVTRELQLCKAWAATIEYTPDHLPILGPARTAEGEAIEGVWVASAGGHGMMWGPAVARIAADLALGSEPAFADVSDLGLDRFDAQGRSRLEADPIALPFPLAAPRDGAALATQTSKGRTV